jgi:hypothetical protein
VLDIGKGFGKYGFLLHEYVGLDSKMAPKPELPLKDQSSVVIDCVDVNPDYCFPHIKQFYTSVWTEDILESFEARKGYDLVLMSDVIEHLPYEKAFPVLQHFLGDGAILVVSTPNVFFDQDLYESPAEHHVSFWRKSDFKKLGCFVDSQRVGPGTVHLLSRKRIDIRGFGGAWIKKVRRIARCLLDESRSS